MKLENGTQVPESTPCGRCGTEFGRKVEWPIDGERVVLCRECFYRAEAEGTEVGDLMAEHGFDVRDTAGGCNAYGRDLQNGGFFLVTGIDDSGDATNIPTSLTQRTTVGEYNADADFIDATDFDNLTEALAYIDSRKDELA